MAWLRLPYVLIQWSIGFLIYTVILTPLGWIAVPIALVCGADMEALPIWGNYEGIPKSYDTGFWKRNTWYAWRNPCHNSEKLLSQPKKFSNYGATDSMDAIAGFQWRYRHSWLFDALRLSWGEPRPHKGKREFYIGFPIGTNRPYMGFTIQPRFF